MKHLRITWIGGLSLVLVLLSQGFALAQQETVPEETDEAAEKLEELRPVIDLGRFDVKDFRPTRNETVKLTFTMFLAMNKSTSKHTLEELEFWKHRLRNQVLISIRLSERQDFLESDLNRLRRIVKIRTNRVLKSNLVDEVLLTEFTFTTN